ncbi:MAG: ATP-dependent 6-phosphofructokinase [Dehalococcoidia bacterium]
MDRIAILTSGGDAPGMNACIRAVTRHGIHRGLEVVGVRHGFDGLIAGEFRTLGPRDVGNIIQRGGTVLGSSRSKAFHTPEGREQAVGRLQQAGVDGLVVCGGNGSFAGAVALGEHWDGGIAGVPATIDNDISGTDTTIGYDTAINTALEAIDRIRDTAESQERVFLVEVMGRTCGSIALDVALAGGAVAALVPESPYDLERLVALLKSARMNGRTSNIIIVAEGEEHGGAFRVAEQLQPHVPGPLRVTVLGHIQRGGAPTAASRILGTRLGVAAVDALIGGASGVMTAVRGSSVMLVPLREAIAQQRPPDTGMVDLILGLVG